MGKRRSTGIYIRHGKRGDDLTYYIRYSVDGHDVKERVGRRSRGFTKEMAQEALRSRLGDIAQGRFNLDKVRKAVPFSVLAKRFREYAKTNWQEATYKFISYAETEFGDLPLSDLTSWRVNDPAFNSTTTATSAKSWPADNYQTK